MNSQLLILGLHRVGFPPTNAKIRGLFISPKLLTFQLLLIQKMGYRFLTLKNALAEAEDKNAVITFDDGYADNYTTALPILQKFNAPATIFVITKDIGKSKVVWREAGEDLPADIVSWEMLSHLQGQGWEIGSHAHEHIHLACYSESEQEAAIERSITEIKQNLGIKPVSFAYPYGSYNETTKKILHRLGLKYAVTTNPTLKKELTETRDLLELSRVSLGGRQFHHYAKSFMRIAKAVGAFAPIKGLVIPSTLQTPLKSNARNQPKKLPRRLVKP